MAVIRAAQAPQFTLEGTTITGLASPSRGSTEISAWRLRIDPGVRVPAHILSHEEVFVVLGGSAVATIGAEESAIGAGDALVVPTGLPFHFAITGDVPFEAVAAMTAGGQARWAEGEGAPFAPPWSV